MTKIDIGISEKKLENIITILSSVLADETTLYIKTRKFHWNVSGNSFMEFHKLFESQYIRLEEFIDQIAERIGKLGGETIGTMKEYLDLTSIKEYPGVYTEQKKMLKELLEDHEIVIKLLRKDVSHCSDKYEDVGTADFLTGIMEDHETMAWMIRRYLV